MSHVPTTQDVHGVPMAQEGVSMPSRTKKGVLLRGKLSGTLIVGNREWYEHEKVARSKLWKLVTQSNDEAVLNHMMKLGNRPSGYAPDDIDKWFKGANKC